MYTYSFSLQIIDPDKNCTIQVGRSPVEFPNCNFTFSYLLNNFTGTLEKSLGWVESIIIIVDLLTFALSDIFLNVKNKHSDHCFVRS